MSLRIGMKVLPGVYASTRIGGRRRKPRNCGLASFIGGAVIVGLALEHAWLIFGILLPLGIAVFCFIMAAKMWRRKRS